MRHLLWTGGWDSTYRICQSVLIEGEAVQPHYIVDPGRHSSSIELETVRRLREVINARARAELIAPPWITQKNDIAADAAITDAWKRLRARSHLGSQYDWLGRYASQIGVPLELAIHVDDKAYSFIRSFADEGGLAASLIGDPDLRIFERFRFPILRLTKREMGTIALRHGFADILEQTWFCFRPRSGRPCGECPPCRYTTEEGLARRIPVTNRLRARARRLEGRMRTILQKIAIG